MVLNYRYKSCVSAKSFDFRDFVHCMEFGEDTKKDDSGRMGSDQDVDLEHDTDDEECEDSATVTSDEELRQIFEGMLI